MTRTGLMGHVSPENETNIFSAVTEQQRKTDHKTSNASTIHIWGLGVPDCGDSIRQAMRYENSVVHLR
jgi:hypothetical protein